MIFNLDEITNYRKFKQKLSEDIQNTSTDLVISRLIFSAIWDKDFENLYQLSLLLETFNQRYFALKFLEKSLRLNPQYKRAKELMKRLLKDNPDSIWDHFDFMYMSEIFPYVYSFDRIPISKFILKLFSESHYEELITSIKTNNYSHDYSDMYFCNILHSECLVRTKTEKKSSEKILHEIRSLLVPLLDSDYRFYASVYYCDTLIYLKAFGDSSFDENFDENLDENLDHNILWSVRSDSKELSNIWLHRYYGISAVRLINLNLNEALCKLKEAYSPSVIGNLGIINYHYLNFFIKYRIDVSGLNLNFKNNLYDHSVCLSNLVS